MKLPPQITVLWTSHVLRWRVGATLILTAAAMLVTFWANEPAPYEYIKEGSHIKPPSPEDGQDIVAIWKIKPVRKLCPATSRRELSDPESGAVLSNYSPTPRLITVQIGNTEIVKTFTLPKRALPYELDIDYRALLCFACNPYQYVFPNCIWTPKLKFQVRKPTG